MSSEINKTSPGQICQSTSRCGLDYGIEALCGLLGSDLSRPEAHARLAAQSLNISLSRFQHAFKQKTGISFGRFVKQARLNRAKMLLLASRLSVKEVSVASGFRDISHFVRDFKAIYGESPSQLRAAALAGRSVANSANE